MQACQESVSDPSDLIHSLPVINEYDSLSFYHANSLLFGEPSNLKRTKVVTYLNNIAYAKGFLASP